MEDPEQTGKAPEESEKIMGSLPSFLMDANEIQNVPESDQADELRGLGISVFDQGDLERGIMGQVDRMVQQKEREHQLKVAEREAAVVRREIG